MPKCTQESAACHSIAVFPPVPQLLAATTHKLSSMCMKWFHLIYPL